MTYNEQLLAIENAKIKGNPRLAGQLSALYGIGTNTDYGCHYGMRSTREFDKQLFREGFNEVSFYLNKGDCLCV